MLTGDKQGRVERAHLAILDFVALSTADSHDHGRAIEALLSHCRKFFNLPLAMVARVQDRRCIAEFVQDQTDHLKAGYEYDLATSYCAQVVDRGQSLFIHDAAATSFAAQDGYRRGEEDTYIGACLFIGGEVYGTVNLAGPAARPEAYAPEDVHVLETVAALISQHLTLKLAEERFDLAIRGSQVGLWEWDLRKDLIQASPSLRLIIGELGVGKGWGLPDFLLAVHPDHREAVEAAVRAHLDQRERFDIEYPIRHENGAFVWVRVRGQAQWDADGTPIRMAGSMEDISARLEADLRIRLQTEELKRTNTELERFAMVAAHDLQEPLRKISMFGEILARDYAAALDQRGHHYLDRMIDGAHRLSGLIRKLLLYSRTSNLELTMEAVDLGQVLTDVTEMLSATITEHSVSIIAGELPVIAADPESIRLLFQNLVENAIKYRGEATPKITIEATTTDDGDWHLTVGDNGIGFAAEHAEKIFDMFVRLHGRADRPGAGIGLALCRRIVERHGGRIWAEGEPARGARIHLVLPARPLVEPAAGGRRD